jgi:hypothetical protein
MLAKRALALKFYRPRSLRLLDHAREVTRYHHYSYKTKQVYVG